MSTTSAVQKPNLTKDLSLADLLRQPQYAERFQQVLGSRAGQFTSSVLSVGMSLGDVEPVSVLKAAMTAAALDLPIDKNLGFAWIVPYKDGDRKLAQFQMGWKGFVQLALRTGVYSRMNVKPINAEAFGGFDDVGEPKINWDQVDETLPAIGYAFAWRLTNGFTKVCFWSKAKVEAHAKRYSQAYARGYTTPWKTHFDQMAMKTIVKNELGKWGILSIQFQDAVSADQSADDGKQRLYPDGNDTIPSDVPRLTDEPKVPEKEAVKPPAKEPTTPVKEKQSKMAEVLHKPHAKEPEQPPVKVMPDPTPEPEPEAEAATSDAAEEAEAGLDPAESAEPAAASGAHEALRSLVVDSLTIEESDFLDWLTSTGRHNAKGVKAIADLPEAVCVKVAGDVAGLNKCRRIFGKTQAEPAK